MANRWLIILACLGLCQPALAAQKKPLVISATGQTQQVQPGDTITPQPSTGAASGLNIPPGTAPTSPNNGDVWVTSAGLYAQINGATIGPFSQTTGTVTSVSLALPTIFSVSGSPITSSGTLTATFNSQSPNTFLAAPNGSSGNPTFRQPVIADISGLGTGVASALAADVSGSGSIALTTSPTFTTPALGTPSAIVLTHGTGLPLTSGVTGILPSANGGTATSNAPNTSGGVTTANGSPTVGDCLKWSASGVQDSGAACNSAAGFGSQTANTALIAPNGSNGVPTFRSLVTADVPTGTTGAVIPLLSGANTFGAMQTFPAPTTANASINLPHGTAPTSPNNGDLWTTTGGLYAQINGSTIGPYIPANIAAPHVASNAALSASSSTSYPNGVWRDSYSPTIYAPPLFYTPSSSACSLNSGAGDNGSQVASSDSKCWLSSFPSTGADIREFGVVMGGGSADLILQQAENWAEANAGTLTAPGGTIAITGAHTVALNHMALLCTPAGPDANASGATLGQQGTTFLLTSTSVQPFTLKGGVRIQGCNFYWPNQNGVTSTPTAYPPLFTEISGQQMVNIDLDNLRIINAYDFIGATSVNDAMGNVHITDTYGYCVRYCFNIAYTPEMFHISGFTADPNLFQNVVNTGNQYLQKWSGANSAFIRIFGNGNGSTTASTVLVQGLTVTNSLVLNFRYGVLVDSSGFGAEMDLKANWDGTATAFQANAGNCTSQVLIDGLYYAYQTGANGSDNAPVFNLQTPATNCTSGNIDIRGQLEQAQGDVLDIVGGGWEAASITLQGPGTYGRSSTTGPYTYASANMPNGKFSIANSFIQPALTTGNGVTLTAVYNAVVNGNTFNGVNQPINLTGVAVPVTVAGNLSESTTATYSVAGSRYYLGYNFAGNSFDKPNPLLDGPLQATSITGGLGAAPTFTVGAGAGTGATVACTSTYTCDNVSGRVTLTTAGVPAVGVLFTINFGITRENVPNCTVSGSTVGQPYMSSGNGNSAAVSDLTAPAVAAYQFTYTCLGA